MVSGIEVARVAARKALESTYEGVATVVEHRKVKDKGTKLTSHEDVVVLEGQPCKLSFSGIGAVDQGEPAAGAGQTVKLFLSPDVPVKPGSKITVAQSGVTADYTYSGVPAVYETHQEIVLELFREWA